MFRGIFLDRKYVTRLFTAVGKLSKELAIYLSLTPDSESEDNNC
jgi:hypothetical protein